MLENPLRTVQIRVLPSNIPEAIVVDVSGFAIGDSIHVSGLDVPEGVEILDLPEALVAAVNVPRIIELDEVVPEGELEEGELEEGEDGPERVGDDEDGDDGDDDA